MEVFLHRFNLDDAPRHLCDAIKNNLTNDVWRYNNVYEGDGLLGMEGLVIEDDAGDEQDDAGDEQEVTRQTSLQVPGWQDGCPELVRPRRIPRHIQNQSTPRCLHYYEIAELRGHAHGGKRILLHSPPSWRNNVVWVTPERHSAALPNGIYLDTSKIINPGFNAIQNTINS